MDSTYGKQNRDHNSLNISAGNEGRKRLTRKVIKGFILRTENSGMTQSRSLQPPNNLQIRLGPWPLAPHLFKGYFKNAPFKQDRMEVAHRAYNIYWSFRETAYQTC